jgi:hypothetical protein
MTYRAVPVAALLGGMTLPADSVIEAVALDGFIAQLPLDLVLNTDPSKAVAWLAIEPQDHPWPAIPGKERGPVLHRMDRSRGREHPQRAMAVSDGEAREPILAGGALTRARRRPGAVGDGPDPRGAGPVRRSVPHLPQTERRRRGGCRPRSQFAEKPDRIPDARRTTHSDPQPEIGAHLARAGDARLPARLSERPRDRPRHRLSQAHGSAEAGPVA